MEMINTNLDEGKILIRREEELLTDNLKVGDVIWFTLENGEEVEAMAMKKEDDGMIFAFVDCLKKPMPMKWDNRDLNDWLNYDLYPMFPEKARSIMKPFKDGSMLRLMSIKEVFGKTYFGAVDEEDAEQFEPMKNRKNRVAGHGKNGCEDEYANWWLRSVRSGTAFCVVASHGLAGASDASASLGVRPAFKISIS